LLGWSLGWAANSFCRVFGSLDFRIRSLCTSSRVVCHYQPIVDLSTGRVIGCEVLARLQDGPRLLYPDEFIPALNRKKLAWALDAAVSERALMELGTSLPHLSSGFTVALNFFPGSLNRDRIHAHLQKTLKTIARNDFQIKLEITEYEFSETLEPEIRKLREDGYRIAIDDFGTGYSNLGIVKRISPDVLKIDKSFVFEMEDATVRSSLIPEIVAIARAIRCDVVAEGIETASQANRLLALGVRFGQGYYFLRPAPIDKFLDYLQSGDLWAGDSADLKP
jgi:sensor c-di-GMP phosphodiesterase-like protein